MKFYIVDNGSKYLEHIIARIVEAGHEYFVQTYSPFEQLDAKDADMIILSGGMQNEVADDLGNGDPWYRYEFDLIKHSTTPILGICLGLQMIAVALGGSLRRLPSLIESDDKSVALTEIGQDLFATTHLSVHEKHQWIVDDYANTGLEILGSSEDGIEILRHPTKPIIGTQFHPEIDVTQDSGVIFWALVNAVTKRSEVVHAT